MCRVLSGHMCHFRSGHICHILWFLQFSNRWHRRRSSQAAFEGVMPEEYIDIRPVQAALLHIDQTCRDQFIYISLGLTLAACQTRT